MLACVFLLSRAACLDWNPDIEFKDCTHPYLDLSTRHEKLSQSCGVDSGREKQQIEFSNIFVYKVPNMETLFMKLKTDVWRSIWANATRYNQNVSQEEISKNTTSMLHAVSLQLSTDIGDVIAQLRNGLNVKLRDTITGISDSLTKSGTELSALGRSQRRMAELYNISNAIMDRMNNLSTCVVKLAQVGRPLFLSGEVGASDAVLKECDALVVDELKGEVRRIEGVVASRRFLSGGAHFGGLMKRRGVVDMEVCLRQAKYSNCTNVDDCKEKRGVLFAVIRSECRQFVHYMDWYKRLQEAKALQEDHVRLGSWLQIIVKQSGFIQHTTEMCARDAAVLYNISLANAQKLAKVAKCIELGTGAWTSIVKECVAANHWSRVFFPFYNIDTVVNNWKCLHLMNIIIAVSISFVFTFLVLSLLRCACIASWRKKDKPQSLPVYVESYRDRYLTGKEATRPSRSKRNEKVAVLDARKRHMRAGGG